MSVRLSAEDIVFMKESMEERNSECQSVISVEDRSLASRMPPVMNSQVSTPPLFLAELQDKTENMRKIQSLEGSKWKYDTTGY